VVFKSPYGFLIKHFKLIHLILTGLFIFLAVKVNSILNYYNDFISGTVGKLNAIEYVTSYYIIVVILIVIISLISYALLRYKDKPRKLYLVLIAFVLITALIINMSYGGLEKIYISVLETKTLRLYRDILRILTIFQYISIGVVLVRGLGFDIKKFNFVEDLHELNMVDADSEEIELTISSTNVLQRKFNRNIRELKYYYLENRIFILIIIFIILLVGAGTYFFDREVINKVYTQGERVKTDLFQFLVMDTYVTNHDYKGNVIIDDNFSFVVLKVRISPFNKGNKFNTSNLILNAGNKDYSVYKYNGDIFKDLGEVYSNQKLVNVKDYLFVFKVDKNNINKKMVVSYVGDKKVSLIPKYLDSDNNYLNYSLGDNIDFSKTVFGNGYFKIENFDVKNEFEHTYNYEIDGKIFNGKYSISSIRGAILKLKISSNFINKLDNFSFLNTYSILKYKYNDKEFTSSFDNKTPGEYNDGLYLSVDKKMIDAQEIWFEINIRNKVYKYSIK